MIEPIVVIQWCPMSTKLRSPARSSGFSLVEVLIAMVLSLITFLIMYQMLENWDASKRRTASGSDSQVGGSIAIFKLERDLRLSGYGFGSASELGCAVTAYDNNRPDLQGLGAKIFRFTLAPIMIVDGTAGAPDQIITLYGSAEGLPNPPRYFSTFLAAGQNYLSSTATSKTMDIGGRGGIQLGDIAIVAQSTALCGMVQVTDNASTDLRTFGHTDVTTSYDNFYDGSTTLVHPRYNNTAGYSTGATGRVYVLGPTPKRNIWRVRGATDSDPPRMLSFANDLDWTGPASATVVTQNTQTDVADNIINLQAQYGLARDDDTTVCTSTDTAGTTITWTNNIPSGCWRFVWAVRVALLMRSDQFEKEVVASVSGGNAIPPTWFGNNFAMTNIDGTADSFTAATMAAPSRNPNDWRHYRHRVFETIVPLKNAMWGTR